MLKKKSFNLAVDMVSKLNKKSTSTMTLTSLINLGLASRYTSYVAVDPKEQKDLKESWMMMKSRDIPVQVAHGWGGASRIGVSFLNGNGASRRRRGAPVALGGGSCMSFGSPRPMMPMMPMPMSNWAPMMMRSMKQSMQSVQPEAEGLDDSIENNRIESESLCRDDLAFENMSDMSFDASTDDDKNQPQENTDDDKLMKLVSSQNFDGSFKLETSIAQLLDTTTDDITQGIFSHFSLTNKIQY